MLPPRTFLTAESKRPLSGYRSVHITLRTGDDRTVSLASIPHHDTAEGRVLSLRRLDDRSEGADRDVAGLRSGRASSDTDVDLDVLVGGLGLGPVVPGAEVPVSGAVVATDLAVVVV